MLHRRVHACGKSEVRRAAVRGARRGILRAVVEHDHARGSERLAIDRRETLGGHRAAIEIEHDDVDVTHGA